jgi:FlaG/FlaF family flagellin (archaellin)
MLIAVVIVGAAVVAAAAYFVAWVFPATPTRRASPRSDEEATAPPRASVASA